MFGRSVLLVLSVVEEKEGLEVQEGQFVFLTKIQPLTFTTVIKSSRHT